MDTIRDNVDAVRTAIALIRNSVKRRDIFQKVEYDLGLKVELLCLDVATRWSSTFYMRQSAYTACQTLTGTLQRISEVTSSVISEDDWTIVDKLRRFLEQPPAVSECQSGSTYWTLCLTTKLFESLISLCRDPEGVADEMLSTIAKNIWMKLEQCRYHVYSPAANLARVFDPRTCRDFESDFALLREHINLPVSFPPAPPRRSSNSSIIGDIIAEGVDANDFEDEI